MCSQAIAIFNDDQIKGSVVFHQCEGERATKVTFDLHGLEPNRKRAIHIHTYGDMSNGCKSLGGHWNPSGNTHGTIHIKGMERHAGDLINNFITDQYGRFNYSYVDNMIRVKGPQSIVGRSVVIHDGADDLGLGNNPESLITGNAGNRFACAVIGLSNMEI